MVSFNYISKSQELTEKGLILSAPTRGQADQSFQVNFQSLNVGERSEVFQMECNLKWEAGRRENRQRRLRQGSPLLTLQRVSTSSEAISPSL